MANWVFCNRCFQPPHRTSCFSLTNCGHVYCDACLGKGKKNECLICKAPCRTVLLSKHTDADIQAFFMSIDSLCKKYSRETSQYEIITTNSFQHNKKFSFNKTTRMPAATSLISPRQSEIAAGPARISVISPPQDGRMGSVSSRGPEHPGLTPSQRSMGKPLRIPPLQIPYKGPPLTPTPQLPGRAGRGDSPSFGGSQARLPPRPPISISSLLQRQCLV
ncbi:probable E3 SUMO-protein ligase RNF212 isoform X4 [Pan paniscus]|uniref:probable E3 SUMO-protein ligase RNF212 isoform X4 n=1 Tax=Pan paniscus TaxID=9597 RepID=UPI0007DBACD1|nr:probable E3 SUMO-protein ligase RNF212 isoform X4 [Pan paniscus]XP_016808211.1 probable E3 SUMO-protein ligase RNF212 isoform X5 [Pan troglodytes]